MTDSNQRPFLPLLYFVLFLVVIGISGCGSSKVVLEDDQWADQWEQQPDETQQAIDQLTQENQQLRLEIARMGQENRNLNARIAEMEKLLMEERLRAAETAKPPAEPPPSESAVTVSNFDREYTRAYNLFMNREYSKAHEIFGNLLNSGVSHPLLPNCQYWIGESLYGMRDFRQAIQAFTKVFDYPTQVKHDDAQVMIANSYYMLGDRQRARQEYQQLIDRYPNSDLVNFARQRLGEL